MRSHCWFMRLLDPRPVEKLKVGVCGRLFHSTRICLAKGARGFSVSTRARESSNPNPTWTPYVDDSASTQSLVIVCRAGTNLGPMAIPPAGVPEPHPTNTQETPRIFTQEVFRPTIPLTRKCPRRGADTENELIANPEFASCGENNGRVTNQDVRQFFTSFKEALARQTDVIEAVKAEIQELKAEQQLLRAQNAEL